MRVDRVVNKRGELWVDDHADESHHRVKNIPLLQYRSDQEQLAITQDGQLFHLSFETLIDIINVKQVFGCGYDRYRSGRYLILTCDNELILIELDIELVLVGLCELRYDVRLVIRTSDRAGSSFMILTDDNEWFCLKNLDTISIPELSDSDDDGDEELISPVFIEIINSIKLEVKFEDIIRTRTGIIMTTDGIYTFKDNEFQLLLSSSGIIDIILDCDVRWRYNKLIAINQSGQVLTNYSKNSPLCPIDNRLIERLNQQSQWKELIKLCDDLYLVNMNGEFYSLKGEHLYLTDLPAEILRD